MIEIILKVQNSEDGRHRQIVTTYTDKMFVDFLKRMQADKIEHRPYSESIIKSMIDKNFYHLLDDLLKHPENILTLPHPIIEIPLEARLL